ncbi:mitofilin family membrane protein [Jiella mangrovi]|uniref:mitofilin family membrane protein n=1 Tax=Jiella mangrovi TaxID=2821407 RepID=UPI001AE3857F|nr:mitofilin family membrane protein [Jiella mangrovi]
MSEGEKTTTAQAAKTDRPASGRAPAAGSVGGAAAIAPAGAGSVAPAKADLTTPARASASGGGTKPAPSATAASAAASRVSMASAPSKAGVASSLANPDKGRIGGAAPLAGPSRTAAASISPAGAASSAAASPVGAPAKSEARSSSARAADATPSPTPTPATASSAAAGGKACSSASSVASGSTAGKTSSTSTGTTMPGSPPPPNRSGGVGMGGVLGAAVLGAVLALGGAWILTANGLLGGAATNAPATADNDYATASSVDDVQAEIAKLRDELSASAGNGGGTVDLAPIEERIAALESTTADIAAIKQTADTASETATASQQAVAGIKATSDKASADAGNAVQQASAASQAAEASRQAASGAVETANTAQSTAQSALDKANSAASAASAANEAASSANSKVDNAMSDLQERIAAIEAANKRAEIALAAANLKSSIDTGGPFARQLETYAETAGSTEATGSLRTFAADGVPTERQLAAQWPDVETKIAAALSPPQTNAPVGDQVLAGLRSLVQVRASKTPPPSDTSDSAILARLDAAIDSGDLKGFSSEWETLPDDAKSVSADFADKVKARMTAQGIVASTLEGALTGSQPASSDTPAAAEPDNQG